MSGRVLVVDDNEANKKLARVTLECAGFTVDTATDAVEAERAIAARRPDLILMDVQLPGVDGLTLTRRLKADPATRGILVVALTAYAMKGDDRKAREAGCDGYVTKPIDTRALPGVVAGLLARRPAPAVLIVEDDPSFGKLLRLSVEQLGARAVLCDGPEAARAALASLRPRLVIVDGKLRRDGDGLALCAEIKSSAAAGPAVVLLSGSGDLAAPAAGPGPDLRLMKTPETLQDLPRLLAPYLS